MCAGALANVQYPHLSRHNIVSGMKTFGEYVMRLAEPRHHESHAPSAMSAASGSQQVA